MTPKQQKSLCQYILDRAVDLGLRDWTITLGSDPPGDETLAASIACTYGRRNALIRVARDFVKSDPDAQRATIIHELLHIHTDQTLTLVHEALPDLIGGPAFHTFSEGYRQANEHGVDAIADAIASNYPHWKPPK